MNSQALVLVDAELGVLDLVIVDVPVEANDYGTNVLVVLEPASWSHVGRLVLPCRRPRNQSTSMRSSSSPMPTSPMTLHLLPRLLELGELQVRRRGKKRS